MIFSYNWLKDYIKGKIPEPKKVAELLMFHSFEVEELKKSGKDWLIDISVLPNRAPDCLCHIGIAREIAVLLGKNMVMPLSAPKKDSNLNIQKLLKVDVEDENDCPRYGAIYLKDVKIKNSPAWLQERLKICGLQPINNVVDAANYVMLEMGQPLHIFDADKLGKQIIVRRAYEGEKILTLDKKTFSLDPDILVIAAPGEGAVAIAGIKGGESTGVSKTTRNIVVEAANFNQSLIRKASQKLKLKTDASLRFEHGIDPNLIDEALLRVAYIIQKIAGGKMAYRAVDVYPHKVLARKINLDIAYVQKLLGIKISAGQCCKILTSLGFQCISDNSQEKILVSVPTRRLDVWLQEDLIEEIGRIYGYYNIQSVFPQSALIPPARNDIFFWAHCARQVLKEMGFCEAYNYSFIGKKEQEFFNWKKEQLFEIQNPVSALNKYLRPSLVFGLLKNAQENLKNFSEVKMFEIGDVFEQKSPKEKTMLGGVLSSAKKNSEGFFVLKGMVEELLNDLGISDVWYDEIDNSSSCAVFNLLQKNQSAHIKVGNKLLGWLGEINFKILDEMKINQKIFMFEMNFAEIVNLANEQTEYEEIIFHPALLRDLSITVPLNTKTADILNIIYAAGADILQDVDLFDTYCGENLAAGKQNLTFHLRYQSPHKTLSAGEVSRVHNEIIKALEKNPQWEVKK